MVLEDALAGLRDGFDQSVDVGVAGDELFELCVEFGDDVSEPGRELPTLGVLGAVDERLELGMVGESSRRPPTAVPASR